VDSEDFKAIAGVIARGCAGEIPDWVARDLPCDQAYLDIHGP
jgi:hypothetical protein